MFWEERNDDVEDGRGDEDNILLSLVWGCG
jgi:hypothetical protein